MARTMPTVDSIPPNGTAPDLAGLVPVDQDSREVSARRLVAQATDVRDRATERRQTLQRTHTDPARSELDRLEAELALPAAIVSEREAEIVLLRAIEEERAVRAQVLAELRAALDPHIKAAAFAVQRAMERVRDTEHTALLALVERAQQLTGSYDERVASIIWACFTPSNGGDDQVAARRRYLEHEIRWTS